MTDLAKFLSVTEDKNPTQTSLKQKGTLPLHMIKLCVESSCFNKFIRTLKKKKKNCFLLKTCLQL